MKKVEFWIIYQSFWPKKLNQNNRQCLFVFKKKSTTLFLKNLINFSKIDKNLGKNFEKCE